MTVVSTLVHHHSHHHKKNNSKTGGVAGIVLMLALLSHSAKAWGVTSGLRRTRPIKPVWTSSRLYSRSSSSSSSSSVPSATTGNNESCDETVVAVAVAPEFRIPKKFVPFPFQYHEELTLRVDALTNLGMGICRIPVEQEIKEPKPAKDGSNTSSSSSSSSGATTMKTSDWVIFVPNTIPGELVQLRVYRNYKSYSDADLLEVREPSPHRVEPLCPLSQLCGGCQYQHMSIDFQREWKTQQVQDGLERIGGFDVADAVTPALQSTVGTDDIWHYRSKITPHYEAPQKIGDMSWEIGSIGFKEKNSRRLVDVPQCFIATEAINEKLTSVREDRRKEANGGLLRRPKKGATLLLRDANEGVVTDHNEYVTTSVVVPEPQGRLDFRFLAGNFFQNNPFMLPVMVQYVVEAAVKGSATNDKMTHLIDCYCGSGLFCLSSAASFEQCVGIEVNERAVEEATENAKLNGIENCAFVAASAEAIFESTTPASSPVAAANSAASSCLVQDFPRDTTVVVCDPPRKGCSEEFLTQLYRFGAQRVVYMSCDAATQARDAKGIVDAGYKITSIQPFDLFPQTRHIECLMVFERTTAR